MEKLKQLLARCKCGVYLTVNEHRDDYETAKEALDAADARECPPRISADVRQRMIDTDTIIELQFYPDTPVGFHRIYHWSIDAALGEALGCFGG